MWINRTWVGRLTTALVVAVAIGGCGGSDKGGATGGKGGTGTGGATAGRGGTGAGGSTGGSAGGSTAGTGGSTGGSFGGGGSAGSGGSGGSSGADAPMQMDAAVGTDGGGMPDAAPTDTRPALATGKIPDPWKGEDIGMVGMPGGSGRNRRLFQTRGSGGDIWAENDAFHFLHRPVTGDVEIVARLTGVERTNQDAKAGVMFRESTAPDSRNVFMLAFPTQTSATGVVTGKGTRLQYRDKKTDVITGFADLGSLTPGTVDAAPVWLRLTRKGSLFEGFMSSDGITWKKDGEATLTVPANLSAGVAVTSHANTDASLASFEGVRITALTTPDWSHAELATVGGFASGAPARFDMVNAGRGIANDEDGVTFVHRNTQHLGDVEVTGKVTVLSYAGTTPSRIGLMLRGSMGADARMMSFVLELGPNGQRYRFQRRAQDGGNISNSEDMTVVPPDAGAPADMAEGDAGDAAAPPAATLTPIWLKLVRVGQRFVGFVSDNGTSWRAVIDLPSFVIASNAYVGVVLTSGREGDSATGRIENVTIAAPTIMLPVRPDAGAAYDAAYDASDSGL
jgi:regulation of enolase protein 1 (concanavalin A-like superfamily)